MNTIMTMYTSRFIHAFTPENVYFYLTFTFSLWINLIHIVDNISLGIKVTSEYDYKNYKFILHNNFIHKSILYPEIYLPKILFSTHLHNIISQNIIFTFFTQNIILHYCWYFTSFLSSLLDLVLSSVLGGADTDTGGTLCWFMR